VPGDRAPDPRDGERDIGELEVGRAETERLREADRDAHRPARGETVIEADADGGLEVEHHRGVLDVGTKGVTAASWLSGTKRVSPCELGPRSCAGTASTNLGRRARRLTKRADPG
jgi:hypothetical protein